MEINELLEVINEYKTLRMAFKKAVSLTDKNIKEFSSDMFFSKEFVPFLFRKELKKRNFSMKCIEEYGICIDALMDIFEEKKGKKLDSKQLNDIDDALKTYILPLGLLGEIRVLFQKYNVDFNMDCVEYMKKYYEKQRNILINYNASKKDIKQYDEMIQPFINMDFNKDNIKINKKTKKH